jgi:hypothetical protein
LSKIRVIELLILGFWNIGISFDRKSRNHYIPKSAIASPQDGAG